MINKVLVVVDMQNDFINGSLGSAEAQTVVDRVVKKISEYLNSDEAAIFCTFDTHQNDYLETQEGVNLPVPHCIVGTDGWNLNPKIAQMLNGKFTPIEKPTFGSMALTDAIKAIVLENGMNDVIIELVGVCTDICVVTNALLLKTVLPDALIKVDASCCAGVTVEAHKAAIRVMKSCQIMIDGE